MLNQRCGETVIAVGFGRRTKRALYLSHSDLSNETVVFIWFDLCDVSATPFYFASRY